MTGDMIKLESQIKQLQQEMESAKRNAINAKVEEYATVLLDKLETKDGQITRGEAEILLRTFFMDIRNIVKF
jgi:DNA-binding protein H-NS